jgi:type 1 glutamine amidotransferase
MRKCAPLIAAGALVIGVLASFPAMAKPVTDCPLRDAPFSAESPLIDILLSPAAKAVVEATAGSTLDKVPARFAGTTPPSFAAILSLRSASMFTGLKANALADVDARLRKLPVTDADRAARCARYDNDVPVFTLKPGKRHILVFEKINGFRDGPSVDAAHAAFVAMAQRKGWDLVTTDKGGAFNAATLGQFDAVIWNNVSGDVLTLSQRAAFQRFLERGGGFVGVHGTAGDPSYFWDWYADSLIGARFKGHPMNPQYQEARIAVDTASPLAAGLPAEWRMTDEWYSFSTNPRKAGAKVILSLDESTYSPVGPMNVDLRMGDHPLAWTNCIGKGRMFYSAIGHRPETYSRPEYVTLLETAIAWAAEDRKACS